MVLTELNNDMPGDYIFTTDSGSTYLIRIRPDERYLCRLNNRHALRKDREIIRVLKIERLKLGQPALFVLEPLNTAYDVTFRRTTIINSIALDEKANQEWPK
ncbi:MAG: hypothetical protein LKE89_06180 [Lactobacillaceae bacterium]|nr:hypothetical protein [Lactobacillaceae bacterium]